MEEHHKNNMNRRDFLKIVGITAATSTAALYGCGSKEGSSEGSKVLGPIPTDKMTYRSFPGLGSDKVSILGYGCMRWPTVPAPDGKGEMIDQDAVNELVDYAIAHGVNYFDTSPMYVQGWSEKSTGIALKRHPRESFYLATKLSNFHPDTWTREGSIAMYRKSFEDMQVDYIDYYLLHMIGGGGMEQFRKRYIDNGMIDFLVKEREAGRIRRLGWSFHGDIEVYDYALQMHDRGEVHWDFVQIQLNYVDWKHASGSNFKAEYLYDELAKRKIPAVIMEPLLGGRLSNVPDHIVARLKQREPERSVASWAFRYAGSPQDVLTVLSGMTYMEHLQDNIRTYSPLVPLTEEETQYLYDTAVDLHEQYNIKPQNFMRVFYDYGTTNPYDDARATTEMNSTSKLSVTAKVYLTDNAGHERSSGNNEQGSTSPVHSGEAYLSGIDYAKYVKHEGYKKEIGTKVADGYVYRYRQVK